MLRRGFLETAAPPNCGIPARTGYSRCIDVQLESPIVAANIDFFTGTPLNKFFLSLIIIDEDDEVTNDTNLSTNVEYKNYGRLGMPIRTPLS